MTEPKIKCPRCRKAVEWKGNPFRPFCSERCRLVDLGHWANEKYAIDGGQAPPPDSDDSLI